ncbi:MAG: peptidase M1 [Deltaproteobacteria bacterium]|nr:peptidase M1 [Deltaproteobacteria bacterium]
MGELRGEAQIELEPSSAQTVSFEAGGLDIDDVWDDAGEVRWEVRDGALHVMHPANAGPVYVDYRFRVQPGGEGWAKNGSTVLWPTFCGNLFPCHPDPADGFPFELAVSGYGEGLTAIYPESLPAEAPPYTLAVAVGKYTCEDLGQTGNGTTVAVCWLPRGKTKALAGTKPLVLAFDWLEQHIGTYTFGDRVASVAAAWGESAAGGMEHHPYWHVATTEMDLPITHVHEATHGWFGTGVRIACWEDFVLSEGTTSYLAARALGAVTDRATERAIWKEYGETLDAVIDDEDVVVLPDGTCGAVDLLADGLFTNVLYMKGAFFWRAVAGEIGADVLDAVFARFYERHVGEAARMQDLLDQVREDTGFDPEPLAERWLRTLGDPRD